VNVGFYHDGPASPHAEAMVRSVRRVMPQVPVHQFSPAGTATMAGVERHVTPEDPRIAYAVLAAYASVVGEWLFLDTDVLVQQDVQKVFVMAFDIAVAERRGTFKAGEEGNGFMTRMPWNKGVVFSRSQAFWQAALAQILTYKPKSQRWMGDQQAMCDVIKSGAFEVITISRTFNYPPMDASDGTERAILHFKGPRKPWMLTRRS
jgi:lipopolysaccharide biosynthesis glycosyltransferase